MTELLMPRLSDSMLEGTVVRWLKRDGEMVAVGEELVEIETDKATVVFEAEQAGVLRIIADEGRTIAIGVPIAQIGDGASRSSAPAAAPDAAAAPKTSRSTASADLEAPRPTAGTEQEPPHPAARAGRENSRPKASPVARRLAEARGVDLADVVGTGPSGRISKQDVEAFATASKPSRSDEVGTDVPASTAAAASDDGRPGSPAGGTLRGGVERLALTTSQATIARRMASVQATMPSFALSADVRMTSLLSFRGDSTSTDEVPVPSITDFVVKAAAVALRAHPEVNSSFVDDAVERYERVNIGIAVAAEGTLLVPTIFDADRKTLGQIALESRSLAQLARDGALTPDQLGGGTFTISNLGMYGVTQFDAMLNHPQAAILAVGSIREHVVLADGQPAVEQRMTVTMTCDHRVLYGADAAAFLQSLTRNLELPIRLAL